MSEKKGLDFKAGVPLRQISGEAIVAGHVDDDEIIVVRRGDECFAVGAHCTHYHGPLADGLLVGDTVRCPWHHACFSLRTGEAVRAPALDPIARWRVERLGDMVFVREKIGETAASGGLAAAHADMPGTVVIVGGGAAGLAAADMLRRHGYDGRVTMFSADAAPPVDRPNLSKDFLAGTAQEDWIPLRSPEFFADNRIDLHLDARVMSVDVKGKRVQLEDGGTHAFDALLLATGAEPVRLKLEGKSGIPLHYLRTFADSQAIIASSKSKKAKRALVIGASFIGLEVAASLRAHDLDVHVVAPESEPLERVMGAEVGRFIRGLHESKGVVFHLGTTVTRLDGQTATLGDGSTVDADFVVAGVGVRPLVALAESAGLAVDRGVVVNQYLETSAPGIFAAGDIARWPYAHAVEWTGERGQGERATRTERGNGAPASERVGGPRGEAPGIRVEHWVVALRQGQTAARNMLGMRQRFDAVPFFWSQHYDISINYVGHAEKWDSAEVDGDLDAHDAAVSYKKEGRTLAVATVFRDKASLEAEERMETVSR